MDGLQVAKRYFDAWNKRDADAIVATFADGGTYSDPSAGSGLTGQAIADYAAGLWEAFPDLSFEIRTANEAGENMVAAQWLMRGTNSGPFHGLPPGGRSVAVSGSDFIEIDGDRIKSVTGYFDSRDVPDQLGLQVVVQPHEIGPFAFGTSVSVQTGKNCRPGAFSITEIRARSDEEVQSIRELSRATATEMMSMEGFISWVGMTINHRMMTVTAWEDPANPKQLRKSATHAKAMKAYYGKDLAAGGMISVWAPTYINETLRCLNCQRMMQVDQEDRTCTSCGAALPESFPYW